MVSCDRWRFGEGTGHPFSCVVTTEYVVRVLRRIGDRGRFGEGTGTSFLPEPGRFTLCACYDVFVLFLPVARPEQSSVSLGFYSRL